MKNTTKPTGCRHKFHPTKDHIWIVFQRYFDHTAKAQNMKKAKGKKQKAKSKGAKAKIQKAKGKSRKP